MQNDTSAPFADAPDDEAFVDARSHAPTGYDDAPSGVFDGPGGVAVAEPASEVAAAGERWRLPTQEPALDPELVAILCGDPLEGGEADGAPPAGDGAEPGRDGASADAAATERANGEEAGEESTSEGDGTDPDPHSLVRAAAALLLASPEALGTRRLAQLLGGVRPSTVAAVLAALSERLEGADLPFVVRELAGGWRLFTDPEVADVVQRLDTSRTVERISPAALETLSIVAYRQPVTKAEIEAIRGVQAGPMLRTLVDRRLVRVVGRADQPGAPLLYGTTQEFLDRFGLASIDDLPRDGELARD